MYNMEANFFRPLHDGMFTAWKAIVFLGQKLKIAYSILALCYPIVCVVSVIPKRILPLVHSGQLRHARQLCAVRCRIKMYLYYNILLL